MICTLHLLNGDKAVMGLNINGSWVDTRNGTVHFSTANDIDRVFFNNTLVWEKIRSLPDVNATHNSVFDLSTYPNLTVAEGYEGELVKSIEQTGGGSTYKESAEITQTNDYITFNLGAAYIGSTVTISIKAIYSTIWNGTSTLPDVGVGWVTANGRTDTNEPNYPMTTTTATVDSSGNVTFQGWYNNRTLYLCACANSLGETLSESGSTIFNGGSSTSTLTINAKLRIQLDVVKDGMTASGYADFTSLSYNDVISIPVYHTN